MTILTHFSRRAPVLLAVILALIAVTGAASAAVPPQGCTTCMGLNLTGQVVTAGIDPTGDTTVPATPGIGYATA
ncbi:MAG TPA: hypothetical protein VGF49_16645, partial [Candidatus Solibacter sp.]